MTKSLTRRTVSTLRTTIVLLAFAVCAAVGFATAQSFRPLTEPTAATVTTPTPTSSAHKDLGTAPAACPLPTRAFALR